MIHDIRYIVHMIFLTRKLVHGKNCHNQSKIPMAQVYSENHARSIDFRRFWVKESREIRNHFMPDEK